MKKILMVAALSMVTFYASAKEVDFARKNLHGLQIYGCEMFIDTGKSYIGTNISNVVKYHYENKTEIMEIRYHDISTDRGSIMRITVPVQSFTKFLNEFQKIKNECAFAPKY